MQVPEAVVPLDATVGPDPLSADAIRSVDWMGGERLLCSWKTPHGYLALSNLRCVAIWRHYELFGAREWRSGPSFFFYNMAPPRLVLGRFVELREQVSELGSNSRFQVRDPEMVRGTIAQAMPAGLREWQERKRIVEEERRRHKPPPPPPVVVREIVREVVRVPCRFCGRLMDDTALRCPSCGGPHLG
jgi:hypothetical protein